MRSRKVMLITILIWTALPAAAQMPLGDVPPSPADSLEQIIAKLLPQIEAKLADLDEDIDTRDLFRTVSVARGYLELGLLDQAAEWFDTLEALDEDELFQDAIFNGRMAISAGRGDIDAMQMLMLENERRIEEPNVEQIVAVYESIGENGHWKLLEEIIENTLPFFVGKPPADVLYLQGKAMRRQGKLPEAIFHYERILNRLRFPDSVHPSLLVKKSMFIQGAADCSFLMNDRLRARGLYSRLIQSDEPERRIWGLFQLAQLDMLDNAYERAEAGFRLVLADGLGMRIEAWAEKLALHCAEMQKYKRYYVNTSPRSAGGKR